MAPEARTSPNHPSVTCGATAHAAGPFCRYAASGAVLQTTRSTWGYDLDLRRFCSTQRAVILPRAASPSGTSGRVSPVWGMAEGAAAGCAVGAGVAVAVLSAGAAVGAVVGAAVGATVGVGASVGAAVGSTGFGEGVGAFIPCAAFSAAPRGRMVAVLFLAFVSFQRFSSPSVS